MDSQVISVMIFLFFLLYYYYLIESFTDSVFEDITVYESRSSCLKFAVPFSNSCSRIIFRRLSIYNCAANCVLFGQDNSINSSLSSRVSDFTFENNLVQHCRGDGLRFEGGCSSMLGADNVFHNCSSDLVSAGSSRGRGVNRFVQNLFVVQSQSNETRKGLLFYAGMIERTKLILVIFIYIYIYPLYIGTEVVNNIFIGIHDSSTGTVVPSVAIQGYWTDTVPLINVLIAHNSVTGRWTRALHLRSPIQLSYSSNNTVINNALLGTHTDKSAVSPDLENVGMLCLIIRFLC